jgi:hypothetical protein
MQDNLPGSVSQESICAHISVAAPTEPNRVGTTNGLMGNGSSFTEGRRHFHSRLGAIVE